MISAIVLRLIRVIYLSAIQASQFDIIRYISHFEMFLTLATIENKRLKAQSKMLSYAYSKQFC